MNHQCDAVAKGMVRWVACALAWVAVFTVPWRAPAQVKPAWVARYSNASPSALSVDNTGNVYVLGPTVTVRYDANGNQLWVGPGGQGVDSAGNIVWTGSGHSTLAQVCGHGHCFGVSYSDFVTRKHDTNGALQWEAYYDGPSANSSDGASLLAVDSAGNVCVSGTSAAMNYRVERFCDPDTGECTYYLSSTAAYDYATVKYAPDGTQLWAANYDGRGNDFPRAMALDAAGNVYVTGVAADAFGQYGDYATVKYSATGRRLWVARYPHDPSPYCASEGNDPRAIAVDAAGNVYVVGSGCKSIPLPNGTVVIVTVHPIVKYDPDGNQLWEISQHNPGENFRPAFLAADVAGNLHVAGSGTSLLKKYDPNGNVLWRVPNSVDVDVSRITALALDAAGNVYLSGQGWLGTGGNQDYVTQKYDAQGTLLWFAGFGGLGNDSPSALAVDDAGNVVVTGTAHRADGGYDMATVKYVPNLDPPQPPRLDSLAVASYSNAIQVITFTLMGEVGRRYTIQGSEDLANWTALKSFFSATGTNQVTDIPTPNTRRRFYRAVTP